MKKILALLVDRANYGRLKPVLLELNKFEDVDLEIMVSGTMPLERFGKAEKIVASDGLKITSRIYMELEGGNPITMSKSLGLSIIDYTNELNRIKPDFLLLIGDRYEALGAAIAAAYSNICIIHVQGGEVSGSIDESARHAITKFSHYHFPATDRSRDYLVRMGENPQHVFSYGCPSADVAHSISQKLPLDVFNSGVGAPIKPDEPYLFVLYHSVTTDFDNPNNYQAVTNLLEVLEELRYPTVWLWPNIDAGTEEIVKKLRIYRESHENNWLRLFKNFPPEVYLSLLNRALCAIGNSSSFVRDSGHLGTPVVLVGERQIGREASVNVLQSSISKEDLRTSILKQIEKGRYPSSNLYGERGASVKIAEEIRNLEPITKKILHYVIE